ncbi:hypothetical protein QUA74_06960 [Microcoleus sp. LAD1_D3]|uniref:hypothetical protein n=1 Tax=Microcoleus sp. LAD1_D3 TaxID=2819365 RepID=UPI002FD6AB28
MTDAPLDLLSQIPECVAIDEDGDFFIRAEGYVGSATIAKALVSFDPHSETERGVIADITITRLDDGTIEFQCGPVEVREGDDIVKKCRSGEPIDLMSGETRYEAKGSGFTPGTQLCIALVTE